MGERVIVEIALGGLGVGAGQMGCGGSDPPRPWGTLMGGAVGSRRISADCGFATGCQQQAAAPSSPSPSFEEVKADKFAFAEADAMIQSPTQHFNARTLVQLPDRQAVVVTRLPGSPSQKTRWTAYTTLRPRAHATAPLVREPVPTRWINASVAWPRLLRSDERVLGGLHVLLDHAHQGRISQFRASGRSRVEEAARCGGPEFAGVIRTWAGRRRTCTGCD